MASSRWFLARRPSSAIHSSSSSSFAADLAALGELLLGEQAGLDPLGELDLHLGVEQRDLADLLEVVLDRVGGGAGDHDLLLGLVGLVGLGDDEAPACLLVLLERRVGRDVLLELLVGDVGQDLLAVRPDHGGGGRRRGLGWRPSSPAALAAAFLAGGLLRPARRPWPRPSWPAPSRRRPSSRAPWRPWRWWSLRGRRGGDRAGGGQPRRRTEMPSALRCAEQRLEVPRLDGRASLARAHLLGSDAARGLRLVDQGDDGRVGQDARRRSLARVRGHEHLSSTGCGARQGPVTSRAALLILPRAAVRFRTAMPRRRRAGVSPPRPWRPPSSAFLKSRTFCSDAGSTTSATER